MPAQKRKSHRSNCFNFLFFFQRIKVKGAFFRAALPKKEIGKTSVGDLRCHRCVRNLFCFLIQSNDQNLEWAENLKEGDISYVEFSRDVGFSKQDIFSISDSAKRDVIH